MSDKNILDKKSVGRIGESIACKFLKNKGFLIKDKNYWKKWGEIDIIAEKDNIIHFIEVKSVSHETNFKPEENVHFWKRERMAKVIQTYLVDKKIPEKKEWQIDIMAIFIDLENKRAKIRMIENVNL